MKLIRSNLGRLAIIGGLIASLNVVHAQTWLELKLTGVSNGLAYLNLYNATNQVYGIWSTTNLLANWNVETEVWPTNPAVMPFTVSALERQNLFVRAEDWTGVDSNGDGIPGWWVWMYFGNLDETATDLDGNGNTLLYDYQNGLDPNVIQFSLQFTNQYVNTSIAYGTIAVLGGVPAYEVVLINDTNFADANWQPYSSNVVVSLNAGDGAYKVWVGLKGLPQSAYQTWHGFHLILDTVPPTIIITNPAAGVVSQPMIQVQGYANKALSRLTFDVSNAVVIQTNLTSYITSRYYDLNRLDFTTNWFQCYDIALNNGLNIVTLHATDLAGNVTTTNVSFTLDYSGDTIPPMLTVIWPQNGTAIGGSSFTLQAQVDDNTAAVTAQIVDASGDTNTVQGLVERSGRVWAQNLPLAAGTNMLTVTATDAAGNTSVTNLTLVQSTVTVTMNPLSSDQQNQWPVTVTGMVSDPSCAVTVNGVRATVNSDGTWEADDVLASPASVASFDVEVYAGSDSSMAVSRKSNSFVYANDAGGISPAFLVSSFKKSNSLVHANDAGADNPIASQRLNQLLSATVVASDYSGIGHYDWTTNVNSLGQSNLVQDETLRWDYLSGGTWNYSESYYSEVFTNFDEGGGSAEVPIFEDGINSWLFTPSFEYAAFNDPNSNYQRIVQTKVMIVPQGIVSLVKTQKMQTTQSYLVRACAASFSRRIKPGNDDDFVNHDFLFNFITGGIWGQQWYAGDVPLPPEWFQINGQTLINTGQVNDDGSFWGLTIVQGPAGATVDVTPTLIPTVTLTNNDYTFDVRAYEIYPPAVDANRDGDITFDAADQTIATNAYRFWVNNDHDGYDSSIGDYDDLDPNMGTDAQSFSITCTRDLEDYTRLWINTQGITEELQNGTFLLALEWKNAVDDPQMQFFQAAESDGGTLYLTDTNVAQQQFSNYGTRIIEWRHLNTLTKYNPFIFPKNFWSNVSADQPVAHLLFDAVSRGSGKLVVSIYKNDGVTKLGESQPTYLKLQDVKEMYERWTVGSDPSSAPATTATRVTTPYQYDSSITAENNYILFVHGWNLAPWEQDAFAETAFKRLYWQDYKGHFVAFQWPTGYGFTCWKSVVTDPDNYDNSESNAWASATGLLGKLNDLNAAYPSHVYLMAHSMGNVVAGQALKLAGSSQVVNTYLALQGAVPAHCYDQIADFRTIYLLLDSGTPDRYANYPTNNGPCYFNGVAGAGSFINFYNARDYALDKWTTDQDLKPDLSCSYNGTHFFAGGSEIDFPSATYEIFAYCDEARCYALGAQANVGGAFKVGAIYQQVDLSQSPYNFSNLPKDHSGEFNSDNMNRSQLWNEVLSQMKLK